jgi:hypothetical protein
MSKVYHISKNIQLTKISTKYIYLNRFVVLTADLLKIQAFLDVTLFHWSSRLFDMKGTTHPVKQHNITVCLIFNIHLTKTSSSFMKDLHSLKNSLDTL